MQKMKINKKSFEYQIWRWIGSLMIPLTNLYGYYIDRPKLTEQKNPFEDTVPPHKSGWEHILIIPKVS